MKKYKNSSAFPVERNKNISKLLSKYSEYLQKRGHKDTTSRVYKKSVEHFIYWLSNENKTIKDISIESVTVFFQNHFDNCNCPEPFNRDLKTVKAALNHLLKIRGEKFCNQEYTSSPEIENSIKDFENFMNKVCGLADTTRLRHRYNIREFLEWFSANKSLKIFRLTPEVIVKYVSIQAKRKQPGYIKAKVQSLNKYIRFLRFKGISDISINGVIPKPPNWKWTSIPETLNEKQFKSFWKAFDRSRAIGKRDFAMARCLADLGLRCYEVAGINLDDIDWINGTIKITDDKNHSEDTLPLLASTGQAVIDYIKNGRPVTGSRAVFVYHSAPLGSPVKKTTVRGAIRRAYSKAGLPYTGTHILRHSIASQLLQRGAPIKEIADVLRHRCIDTTMIYLKIDLTNLAVVAMPWVRGKI